MLFCLVVLPNKHVLNTLIAAAAHPTDQPTYLQPKVAAGCASRAHTNISGKFEDEKSLIGIITHISQGSRFSVLTVQQQTQKQIDCLLDPSNVSVQAFSLKSPLNQKCGWDLASRSLATGSHPVPCQCLMRRFSFVELDD